jgi:hypothetical protein
MPDKLPYRSVNQTQATALNFANHVISEVKLARPFGAANLKSDVRLAYAPSFWRWFPSKSRHPATNQSVVRTQQVYQLHERQRNQPGTRHADTLKPRLLAGIANRYGAGNCDMAGAMAYTLLRGNLDSNFEVMLIQSPGHTYAGFKLQGAPDNEAIIVDPWPTLPMATLAEDHFMFSDGNATAVSRKPGKQNPDIPPESREYKRLADLVEPSLEKYGPLSAFMDQDTEAIKQVADGPVSGEYGNQVCSNNVRGYKDPKGALVLSPQERLIWRLKPPSAPTTPSTASASTTPSTASASLSDATVLSNVDDLLRIVRHAVPVG